MLTMNLPGLMQYCKYNVKFYLYIIKITLNNSILNYFLFLFLFYKLMVESKEKSQNGNND